MAKTDAPQEFNVMENRPRGRVLFTGSEKGARQFVEMNFPRHHVNPGSIVGDGPVTDVHVVGPNGERSHYLGPEQDEPWQNVNATSGDSERESYA